MSGVSEMDNVLRHQFRFIASASPLPELLSVASAVREFGHELEGQKGLDSTLLTVHMWNAEQLHRQCAWLNKRQNRTKLRAVAEKREAAPATLKELFPELNQDKPDLRERYSSTLEALVSYFMVREFGAWSTAFGARLGGTKDGGDFDCLAVMRDSLIRFEVKSGSPTNVTVDEIQGFLDRHAFLAPDLSVLLIDNSDATAADPKLVDRISASHVYTQEWPAEAHQVDGHGASFIMIEPSILVLDTGHKDELLAVMKDALAFYRRFGALQRRQGMDADYHAMGYQVQRHPPAP
jgi:hypothetical protein